jgi:hypothetical protein
MKLVYTNWYSRARFRPDGAAAPPGRGTPAALVAWAAGADMGEPDNAEEVTLILLADNQVSITFRGHAWQARFPSRLPATPLQP